MNINPLSILGTYLSGIRGVKKKEKAAAASYATGSSDHVEISGTAGHVAHLSEQVSLQPDIRADRVSEVEQRIASGRHHPTDAEVAESLVKSTVEDHLL